MSAELQSLNQRTVALLEKIKRLHESRNLTKQQQAFNHARDLFENAAMWGHVPAEDQHLIKALAA